jgi:RimJ/RimL family protein N-acetyltransferase
MAGPNLSNKNMKVHLRQFFVSANAIGIALYEKFGFEIEGTHHRYAFRDGMYVDACSMARIKPASPE